VKDVASQYASALCADFCGTWFACGRSLGIADGDAHIEHNMAGEYLDVSKMDRFEDVMKVELVRLLLR
jgi:hypothetical protein